MEDNDLIFPKSRIYYYNRLFSLGHSFTTKEWLEKLISTNGICPACQRNVGIMKLTIDHNPPLHTIKNEGFVYLLDNVRPLCQSCNLKLSHKIKNPQRRTRMIRVDDSFYEYLFQYRKIFEKETSIKITNVTATREIAREMSNYDKFQRIIKVNNPGYQIKRDRPTNKIS